MFHALRLRTIFVVHGAQTSIRLLLATLATANWKHQLQRAAVVVMASAMFWLGTAGGHTPPASASTAAPTASVMERIVGGKSQDQIVDDYIVKHMFDEDDSTMTDPLESAYREAYQDYKGKGSYPSALKEITAQVLGSGQSLKTASDQARVDANEGARFNVFRIVSAAIRALESRGLSETKAMVVVAGILTIGAPLSMLFFGMIVGGISKRRVNNLMKQRYGETYR